MTTASTAPQVHQVRQLRRLVVSVGDVQREVTGQRIVIGRSRHADIILDDTSVSGRHLEIYSEGSSVQARDLESTNGTWLEGTPPRRIYRINLQPRDQLRIGKVGLNIDDIQEVPVSISVTGRLGTLLGESIPMRELFAHILKFARTDLRLVIFGETGTGKEGVARAVHDYSLRAKGPFIVLDCSSIPLDLAEGTLFGYCKGAFTGANENQAGIFEAADGGTLFLDEIGELPMQLQPKLLRVLEQKAVQRVGEHIPRSVNVRVIAASHRDLAWMVDRNEFREDLYHRLAQVRLHVPSLRERKGQGKNDIVLLAQHFLSQHTETLLLSDAALQHLQEYQWPGNVRELHNAVLRAVHMVKGSEIQPSELGLQVLDHCRLRWALEEALAANCLPEAHDLIDRFLILRAIEVSQGKARAAANSLGLSPYLFRRRCEQLQISRP